MSVTPTVHIDERVPVRIIHPATATGETETLCTVMAQRFMRVLVHPVPSSEMERLTGIFRRGGKIVVDWPADRAAWYQVKPGDQVEVDGRRFTIRVLQDYPHCYTDIYVDEHVEQ